MGRDGITPAPAGNIKGNPESQCQWRDHPRACGEHLILSNEREVFLGSPPRLRGTYGNGNLDRYDMGITPAPAGNITESSLISAALEDHPRACGEHGLLHLSPPDNLGSPPRLRGTCAGCLQDIGDFRITPAPAGNIPAQKIHDAGEEDHPRACGEHLLLHHLFAPPCGSPPRLRGTCAK